MKCLKTNYDDYLKCYFDVSQLEPRGAAYFSEEPGFRDAIYESKKDAYIEFSGLAYSEEMRKLYEKAGYSGYNESTGEWEVKGNYKLVKELAQLPRMDLGLPKGLRGLGKVSLISLIYGRGSKSLAQSAGLRTEIMEKVREAMMGKWSNIKYMMQHKLMYDAYTDGKIETFLGDRLTSTSGGSKAPTQSTNYANQGCCSLLATSSFWICLRELRNLGINCTVDGIVHDSTTQQVPINKIFEAYLCYNRFFRQYIKERFNADLAFDVDIAKDSRDNCTFTFDIESREFFLKGDIDSVNNIMSHIGEIGKDIEIISDEKEEKEKNELDNWIQEIEQAEHCFCVHPIFNSHGTRIVKGKVLRHVDGEELALNKTPIEGIVHYWDVVKKWYEHSIPLNEGDDHVYLLKPVYTYFIPRGKDKQPVIYQAKEHKKGEMYFLPEECEDPKKCTIDQLIPINDNEVKYTFKEHNFKGNIVEKLYVKEDYQEAFHIDAPNKIWPSELADQCIENFWLNKAYM